jgi:hypothetical protein
MPSTVVSHSENLLLVAKVGQFLKQPVGDRQACGVAAVGRANEDHAGGTVVRQVVREGTDRLADPIFDLAALEGLLALHLVGFQVGKKLHQLLSTCRPSDTPSRRKHKVHTPRG